MKDEIKEAINSLKKESEALLVIATDEDDNVCSTIKGYKFGIAIDLAIAMSKDTHIRDVIEEAIHILEMEERSEKENPSDHVRLNLES